MSFDYFYGQQSDLFTFYRVPKVLFTNERFWNISADAKMLYGILLDRMSLSAKNGWIDKNGRVYIIFTIDEAKMALNCAEQKAIKLLSELEKKAGLIERKRQGLGKPNLIYVKNFKFYLSKNKDHPDLWGGEVTKIFVGLDLCSGFYLVEGSTLKNLRSKKKFPKQSRRSRCYRLLPTAI